MLVFEEPGSDTLWLAKGTPRAWLEDGQTIAVSHAPTPWGRLSFSLHSHLQAGRVEAIVELPSGASDARVKLRLRAPEGHWIRSVTANGKPWEQFDAQEETVTVPPGANGRVVLSVKYSPVLRARQPVA
jgi:hypothetical protein